MKKPARMSGNPLFMDFAVPLPAGLEIEDKAQERDCATYSSTGVAGCDDD